MFQVTASVYGEKVYLKGMRWASALEAEFYETEADAQWAMNKAVTSFKRAGLKNPQVVAVKKPFWKA